MRRLIAGLTVLAGLSTLLVLPLASTGQPPNVADQLRSGVNKTLSGVNGAVDRVRAEERKLRERETARRRAAAPRQATPGPGGTGYRPPLHGQNPHGQGTAASTELPPSAQRPLLTPPAGGDQEDIVLGRSRGEQNPDGTYRGNVTIAALGGNDIIPPVNTTPGQTTRFAPLAGVLDPICMGTQVCLTVLEANSSTTGSGSTNSYSTLTASVGGPGGIRAGVTRTNGNIGNDANCQRAHGDSSVADASVGTFTADALESTSDSFECKDGSRNATNTSRVINLGQTGVQVPPLIPAGCALGTPNTPALNLPPLVQAVCNADEVNGTQAAATYGVREALTTFVLPAGETAVLKATTGASESRARMRAQCEDGVDNDGDGRIDFPSDPGCTSPTDDSEADAAISEPPDDEDVEDVGDEGDDEGEARPAGAGGGGGPATAAQRRGGGNALAFTGTNVVLMFLIGSLVLLAGLRLRMLAARHTTRAQRAGMA